jgi:hypothetical protein
MVESAATVEGATAHTRGAARNTCARREDLTAPTHSTSGRRAADVPATHMATATATHVATSTASATHVATATAAVAAATALSKRWRSAKRQRAS